MSQNEIHVESYDELTGSANDMVSTMNILNDDITYIDQYVKDDLKEAFSAYLEYVIQRNL